MTPFIDDPDFTLYVGDALEILQGLPDESVHCCVTSPPYWGLRDYGTEGQLGLEATPDEYVTNMVEVFREVRRVLRADGTLWLNLGDSYAGSWGAQSRSNGNDVKSTLGGGSMLSARQIEAHPQGTLTGSLKNTPGLKQKDLVGIPWRVAFALQTDGWYLRSDIIWSKPNPMPESVTDRPTKAHEYVFLLTKAPRYFFDQEAVREPHQPQSLARYQHKPSSYATEHADINIKGRRPANGVDHNPAGRNLRTVWNIATQPYPDAHFATFPEALPRRCILAGTSERGCCPECGAPWVREVERGDLVGNDRGGNYKGRQPEARASGANHFPYSDGREFRPGMAYENTTLGWLPTCSCVGRDDLYHPPVPCTVLDPFLGSGTTALVARNHNRRAIGIELNEEYAQLAARRLQQLSLLAEPA